MTRHLVIAFSLVALFGAATALTAAESPAKKSGPASNKPASKGPDLKGLKGDLKEYSFHNSRIFPGTEREYWIYVPRQYDASRPACLYVSQDGIQYNAPLVFDKLIESHEMPVVIGVFVKPGRVKALSDKVLDRFNRSYEYDGLGPNYVRFLEDELLPVVEKKTTSDGRPIRISKRAADRCIAGSSSGGICAFTAAWERPQAFSRVFSAVGTYVGLRGGNNYPSLIRKYEAKPIRIFLQDGSQDQNIYAGDWWMANLEMERALKFAGYEVEHVWGEGGHNNTQATEVFPQAMRWLWKTWPAAVKAGAGSEVLQTILIPGEDWQLVSQGYTFTEGPAANAKGEVFFNDVPQKQDLQDRVGREGNPHRSRLEDGQRHGLWCRWPAV